MVSSNLSYLVDVMARDGIVKGPVEVIQQVDDLHGRAVRGQGREPGDVREVDGDAWEHLGRNGSTQLELIGHESAKLSIYIIFPL